MSFSNLTCGVSDSLELNRLRQNELFTPARETAYLAAVGMDELYNYVYVSERLSRSESLEIENKLVEAEKSLQQTASDFDAYEIILNLK